MDDQNNYQDDEEQIEIPLDEIIIEEIVDDDDDEVVNQQPKDIPIVIGDSNIPYNNIVSPNLRGDGGISIDNTHLNNNNNPKNEDDIGSPSNYINGASNKKTLENDDQDQEDDLMDKDSKKKKKKPSAPKKNKDGTEVTSVAFRQLFRFADRIDFCLMFFGSIAAILNGAAMPCVSLIFGEIIDAFNPGKFNNDPGYGIEAAVTKISMWFLILGGIVFALSYLETTLWMIAGERQTNRVRTEYLSSILRQEIGWFDTNKSNELASRINSDTVLYQDAIGEKVGHFLHNISTFFAGFAIGFTKGWQLTLVITSISPLLAFGGGFMAKMMTEMTKQGQEAYARAGGIADENISAIRTVSTFSGETKAAEKYSNNLKDALKVGYKRAIFNGFGLGFVQLVILGTYALAFWYGSTLVSKKVNNDLTDRPWSGGDVVAVFFSVIIGATAIGQASPNLGAFAQGRGAAYKIFQVIDRVSKANPFSSRGITPQQLSGDIEFKDVEFHYPSRPDVPIFKGLNLRIKPGQTIGLVGDSGGGKSTVISLLERFYDPVGGQILLDGEDIKKFNVRALRQKIGLVSQEPVLFATTIEENIRYGKVDATLEEIQEAAKLANAHSFISQLPQGYNTMVGEKGVMISGGQKQRIAIARAIIKNPNILLLDEATSALDSENERIVQEAIDILMKGRTTILIAHRLSTIRNADVIVFVKGGVVVEKGTHDELMAMQNHYFRLVEKQQQQQINNILETGRSRRSSTFSDVNPLLDSFRPSARNLRARPNGQSSQKSSKGKKKKSAEDVPLSRVMKYSSPETLLFIFGVLAAVGTGGVYPAFSIIFTEMLTIFQHPDGDYVKSHANYIAIWFMVLAVGAGICNFFQAFLFSVIGEKLTFRLRRDCFKSIMRQDIGWFDLPENSTGKLTAHLASDASLVQGMTSQRLGIMIQNLMTVLGGLIIAFISGWKLTLVIIACFPLVVITGKIQMRFLNGYSESDGEGSGGAGQVASEAITGIRTVASFTSENQVLSLYKHQLKGPISNGIKKGHISGIAFGVSQLILFCVYCLSFWYGGKLVDNKEWPATNQEIASNCTPETVGVIWTDQATCEHAQDIILGFNSMMRVFFAIVLSAIGVGQASSFAPDIAKAKAATNSIFKLLDTQTKIDPNSTQGDKIDIVVGDIEFKNIHFAYPTRPNHNVFRGFSLIIQAGTTNAFVGDSGGGKSTVISLLERFYDTSVGEIFIDGHNIRNLNVKHLRSLFGLVGQEPTLFSGTIADNIAYGKEDSTQDEIENAARLANAHDFIVALPQGYQTPLGEKFTQLSGGQKQRIAIARAIIRNPKILLLDEATSALDSESERIVQEALENVMKGRTTLIIAHRLSTIQNSDSINYVKAGQIIERGTHEELLEANGPYKQLVSRQMNK
ncbi:ABC transporter B family protein [Tieghemostelium lacteum]|uniref:ABC transporter B family protein n=1 Tax=Tieghemostelium lacteum TaxID=361077 RepID=A0A151ZDW2_TIELA|nr:ABC transporter B family protein [Tieghemostelium lacteum]|eukprot:KYQ92143.1 ABC transporter B family protein [Tieghemostelium lacteum]